MYADGGENKAELWGSRIWLISALVCDTWHLTCSTHFTDREKSPGALSLSRMRKAPSCLCLFSISSALARGIFPKNHLQEHSMRNESSRELTDDMKSFSFTGVKSLYTNTARFNDGKLLVNRCKESQRLFELSLEPTLKQETWFIRLIFVPSWIDGFDFCLCLLDPIAGTFSRIPLLDGAAMVDLLLIGIFFSLSLRLCPLCPLKLDASKCSLLQHAL